MTLLIIILKAKLQSVILIQIKKKLISIKKDKHKLAGLFSSIPVAHGELLLPLSDQEMLVFASNTYAGHLGSQGLFIDQKQAGLTGQLKCLEACFLPAIQSPVYTL